MSSLSVQSQYSQEEIISVYVKELRRYSKKELSEKFFCKSNNEAEDLIRVLKEYGILKAVKKKDGNEPDMSELTDADCIFVSHNAVDDDFSYVFTFVGIVLIGHRVVKCYPKYLLKKYSDQQNSKETEEDIELIDEELKLVVSVIKKYNSSNGQDIYIYTESNEESSFNLLAVYLYLLNDYFEFGVYTNTQEIIENNGSGEILWGRTINNGLAFIEDDCPYYVEFLTRKNVNDDKDYFKRLHECVLTKISKELLNANLLDMFEVAEVDLSDEELGYFGDDNSILYNIDKELNKQYNSRKRIVLETMRAYIQNGGSLNDSGHISLYGTGSFNLVWEKICATLFDNRLTNTMAQLKLELSIPLDDYNSEMRLIEFIEKPYWSKSYYADKTLVPDIVSIKEDKFVIMDAKYYTPKFVEGIPPVGQPGIESVTKQYLYQLAFKPFTDRHEFNDVKNVFLMPTEGDELDFQGTVSMDMFSGTDTESYKKGVQFPGFNLEKIKVRFLPARKCYQSYLRDKKWDIDDLKLNLDN